MLSSPLAYFSLMPTWFRCSLLSVKNIDEWSIDIRPFMNTFKDKTTKSDLPVPNDSPASITVYCLMISVWNNSMSVQWCLSADLEVPNVQCSHQQNMDSHYSYGNSTNDSGDSNHVIAEIPNSDDQGRATSTSSYLESKTLKIDYKLFRGVVQYFWGPL